MTAARADLTPPDLTTTSRTAAKAQAANVPTAYSAVVIPASAVLKIRTNLCASVHLT